jgi:Flp pilus assembly pilin Flp
MGWSRKRRFLGMAFVSWTDRMLSRFGKEGAQTMAEYAVILGVITPVIVVAYALFSDTIVAALNRITALF